MSEQQEGAESPKEQVVMLHFMALMEGLEIPDPAWYLRQDPVVTKKVGVAIADQAKRAR